MATTTASRVTLKDTQRTSDRISVKPLTLPKGLRASVASDVDTLLGQDATSSHPVSRPAAASMRTHEAPPGTLWHEVCRSDTLTSLAVKYNMSASGLRKLNRLPHSDLFPGQRLLVKDPSYHRERKPMHSGGDAAASSSEESPRSASPVTPPERREVVTPQSPFQVVSRDVKKPTFTDPTAKPVREFVNRAGTAFRVKVLYMTLDKGLIHGFLEANEDFVRFWPERSKIVDEFGEQEFTLDFEFDDLLTPTTSRKPPSLRQLPHAGEGCAGHRIDPVGEKTAKGDKPMPVFLQLRLRLVYGLVPTPQTLAQYWFAVMPQWIDPVYDMLFKYARVSQVEPWEPVLSPDELLPPDVAPSPPKPSPPPPCAHAIDVAEVNLLSKSHLLTEQRAADISANLPLRLRYMDWLCVYSSYEDGMSLSGLYRKLAGDVKEPCLMLIRDSNGAIFGAYTTESWRPEPKWYGGGECMVFKAYPELKFYRWTSEYQRKPMFMFANDEYVTVGGGHTAAVDATGAAAIYFDADLLQGASNRSETFRNDCLASSNDFTIDGIEIWQFVSTE